VTYVIRDGKKRGRGRYLRFVELFDGLVHCCHTKRQGRAAKFESKEEAEKAFERFSRLHLENWCSRYVARIVKLRSAS
jgi:hypothetical protein